jgi:hypothetical protein
MILYKRNAQAKPIFWEINPLYDTISIRFGLVGKLGHVETYKATRNVLDEIDSAIKAKRKEGYKELKDLYDNAPDNILDVNALKHYLDLHLPKFNTHEDGNFIPMLCKTLKDNKPFEKHTYFGQWKINGERCIIKANQTDDLFQPIKLRYRSREGVDWTDKLSYLDEYLLPKLSNEIIELMIEEGVGLDGELYLPGYTINQINSFIKNTELPQHYQLQYWLYDLCIDNMSAILRNNKLCSNFYSNLALPTITKEQHLNNTERLVLLPRYEVKDIEQATILRDEFITNGFEGLVIRDDKAEYQFGGKRNNAMLKFKRKEDGKFLIVDIVPEGKRTNLPKFILRNDINDELFECTINKPQLEQELILANKDKYIGKYMLVQFRERSGIKQVPFHAKGINIYA